MGLLGLILAFFCYKGLDFVRKEFSKGLFVF